MSSLDLLFLAILLLGTLYGMWTGLVMQLANVISLLAGVVVAGTLVKPFGGWLQGLGGRFADSPILVDGVAYGIVFLAVVIIVRLLGMTMRGVLKKLKLGSADRSLGALTGFLAGLLVCVAITVMMIPPQGRSAPQTAEKSVLAPLILRGVQAIRLPPAAEKEDRIREFLQRTQSP